MEARVLIRGARRAAGLTQAELAERGGTSQATLSAYESGSKDPSASTLSRLLRAAGKQLAVLPASRAVVSPRAAELERRGEILAQVLDLASRLPSRRRTELRYPRLPSTPARAR